MECNVTALKLRDKKRLIPQGALCSNGKPYELMSERNMRDRKKTKTLLSNQDHVHTGFAVECGSGFFVLFAAP